MASYSIDNDPSRGFFYDLQSFKDYVVLVYSCAPDMFPAEDWRAPEDQMNLDRAFVGLRYGLNLAAKEKGDSSVIAKCSEFVDEAYAEYLAGREFKGQRKLEEVEKLLKNLLSQ